MNKKLMPGLFTATFLLAVTSWANEFRPTENLVTNWRFHQGDDTNANQSAFDDHDWQIVSLPHNWGWEQAQHGSNYLRGAGWYRRELIVQQKPVKRYYLRFEAAGSVADVWLNGKLLGEHRGAFGAFCFEITHQLSANGTNILAVRASNAEEADVAPLSGDFPVYGGLYRPVHLIETDEACFDLTDHASPGVAWLETSVSRREAVLDVTAQISNGYRRDTNFTLVATVLDATGNKVAGVEQQILAASNVTAPYRLRVVLPHPHLWNGRPDPYLYKAVIELRSSNEVQDIVEQNIGIRYYSVDPDKGFYLNGRLYHLHGVDRHQDRLDKGWAISEADQDEDIALIKEIGATVIRCAHYEHSDYFYSLCDRAGILVWAEIPQVDKINGTPQFAETSRGQLLDLIRQNINHPAIFCWSLFNEIRPGHPDPHRELQDLNNVAHAEDPTRPTIAATCTSGLPEMNRIPDLLGWNVYQGWYPEWGKLEEFLRLEKYRTTSQHGGFCISEYGAGANVAQHEQDPKEPKATGQWHPEEWQSIVHEEAWKQMKSRPYIWGTFVWSMFDFTSFWRHEGGIQGRNDKGLVTYDRQTRKDAFYFYKANWSDEPTLYITSRRFVERTNAVTDVKVYSNARRAELFVNGKSQGKTRNDGNAVFVWKNIQLKPGENTIEARASRNGEALTDQCVWQLK
ncbi:MAG TPA: glycoside hydrolase family 2 TIM barrel-domain containing protein [Verrucomicrobiae bacterium]|nr:glycoside hydrolase family 2 TIM barrel-domain containing protein [Verrucomicrobiae bacterium]